ncbi:RHS repeat-associated core domain-containing protein, partial [Shewanella algicola]
KQQSGSVVSTTYYVGSFEREVALSSTVDKTYIGDHTIKMKAHVGSLGNQSPFQHVLRDHLGSVDTLMDAKTGAVLQHRGYDVFGRPRDIAAGNNLLTSWQGVTKGYTDHEHLNEQELIHMNGRIYDFNIGRFLSVDPFLQFPENSQSANPYSYILNNPMSGTDPTGYCQAEDNMSDCSGSLKSGETKAITDADGKRVGTVGKDSNGTTYVTSGGKGDVKDAMAFTNNTGRFKSDVGKQNSIGIKDSSTSYGNSSSFIAGYSSATKGDMTGALSLTPIGQTVDGIKSGIDALEAGYEEYQKTGDLTSAAVVAGKVGTEAYIERKLKVARLPDVTKGRINSAGQPINEKGQFVSGAGGESAAAARGRAAHDAFDAIVEAKRDQGWVSKPRIVDANGRVHIPDALTPSGRPIEYKPNTPSGIKAGRRQLKRYEQVTGKKGRLLTYD